MAKALMSQAYTRTMSVLLPVLGAGGAAYLSLQEVDWKEAGPLLAALLMEAAMFFSLGSSSLRERWKAWSIVLSAALPALLVGADLRLLLIAAGLAFWYVVLPPKASADIGFALLYAAIVLSKASEALYPPDIGRIPPAILGELAFTRIMIWAALVPRRMQGTGFGFVPQVREIAIGIKWFLLFLPAGALIAWAVAFAELRPQPWDAPRMVLNGVGTFLGIYVFVALREEFLFRGLLQQWFTGWLGSERLSLIAVPLVVACVHLPFREFPNWRFAAVAGVAHWFYGQAFREAGGIRAAMIAHALVVATWRVFLR